MPKVKNHIIKEKKDYVYVTIAIILIIACILLIGRVGTAGKTLALFASFLLGDFSTLILAFILVNAVIYLILKKKIDFHHISFIGTVFIFMALLLFTHLGLYDALGMSNTNILAKTLELYKHYLKNYQISYSCGGGIFGAILLQITCMLVSKIGSILIGITFIIIGISYFANVNLLSFLKGGKILKFPKRLYTEAKNYFNNLHYPNKKENPPRKKISMNMLDDSDAQVNFALQNELNKEKFESLKHFLKDHKIYYLADTFYTSYSSSRIVLKSAHKSEEEIKQISSFFNRQCLIINKANEIYFDYPNQFRKLLTLKSLLVSEKNDYLIPIAMDINGERISLDITSGKLITIIGDQSSGIKTFLRCLVLTILIKNIEFNDIYFYDFDHEFNELNNSKFKYVNNEKSAEIALDEAFSEYERRSEVLKYFNCDSLKEVNEQIQKAHLDIEMLYPEIHILAFDLSMVSQSLMQKIVYAIRFSIKVGITIILVARNKKSLLDLELNKSDIITFNVSDVSTSLKLYGSDIACRLQKKGDVIIRSDGSIFHGQIPYVSSSDFSKIVS